MPGESELDQSAGTERSALVHEPAAIGVGLGERLHAAYGPERRIRVLCAHFEPMIPPGAAVLDLGCGNGAIGARLAGLRADLDVQGIDVVVREGAHIPVLAFDGKTIPHDDDSFDVVLLSDVLHHTEDPEHLLGEAARIARRHILLKDHLLAGPFAHSLLRFMDEVGNRRFGIPIYEYWRESRWREAFSAIGLSVESWSDRVRLYPPPIDWIFGRSLHFVARLAKQPSASASATSPGSGSAGTAPGAKGESLA